MEFIKSILNDKLVQNRILIESANKEIKDLQDQLDYILEAKKRYQEQIDECRIVLDKIIES